MVGLALATVAAGGLVARLLIGDGPPLGERQREAPSATTPELGAELARADAAAAAALALAEREPRAAALLAAVALDLLGRDSAVHGSDPERALRAALARTRGRALVDPDLSDTDASGPIAAVALAPAGDKAIATVGELALVWNLHADTLAPIRLRGHQAPIVRAVVSPDGRWLITSGEDRTLRFWDLRSEDPSLDVRVARAHAGTVDRLASSSDGRWLISAAPGDGQARIWDLHADDPTQPIAGLGDSSAAEGARITAVALAADGSRAATASDDGRVRVWPLDAGRPGRPRSFADHEGPALAVALSPDGRWLVSGGHDRTARRYDLNNEVPARTMIVLGHAAPVAHVQIPAGLAPAAALAVTAAGERLTVWELAAKDPASSGVVLAGHEGAIVELAVDPDGRWAVTAGADAKVLAWNLGKRERVVERVELPGHVRAATAVAVSADGRWAVSGGAGGRAFVWDHRGQATDATAWVARAHTGPILDAALTPDGRQLVTAGADAEAIVWGFADNGRPHPRVRLRGHARAIQAVALAPQGRWVATARDDHEVRLWDASLPDPAASPRVFAGHTGEVTQLRFVARGRWLASAGADATIHAWPIDGEADLEGEGGPVRLRGHVDEVVGLATDPRERWLFSVDLAGRLLSWDLHALAGAGATGELAPTQQLDAHEREIWAVEVDPSGTTLVTASADRQARLWTLGGDGLGPDPIVLRGHTDTLHAARFAPDGRWLATGSRDGTVRVWDRGAAHPEEHPRVLGPTQDAGGVEWVVWSPDGARLFAGLGDGSIDVWAVPSGPDSGEPVRLRGHAAAVSGLLMPVDGRVVISASFDGSARVWPLTVDGLIARACQTAGRGPSADEWREWAAWLGDRPYRSPCE